MQHLATLYVRFCSSLKFRSSAMETLGSGKEKELILHNLYITTRTATQVICTTGAILSSCTITTLYKLGFKTQLRILSLALAVTMGNYKVRQQVVGLLEPYFLTKKNHVHR